MSDQPTPDQPVQNLGGKPPRRAERAGTSSNRPTQNVRPAGRNTGRTSR